MAESIDFSSLSIQERNEPQESVVVNVTQPAAVKYIEDSGNVMFIMRGVSGSGKSTIVKYLMSKLNTNCVCSADGYFIKNGEYIFDRTKIKLAHEDCQQKATQFCKRGHSVVIIDNTNVQRWEINFYVDLAEIYGYVVMMVTPNGQLNISPEMLAQRNKHGVSASVIERKLKEFSVINPSYFAWFFNRHSTVQLSKIRDDAIQELTQAGVELVTYSGTKSVLHVTSLYMGGIKEDTKRKAAMANATKKIGTTAEIEVVSIIATKRTIFARVKLRGASKFLYFNDGEGHGSLPKGHAAHITLGLASGVKAQEARSDAIKSHLCPTDEPDTQMYGNITFYPTSHFAIVPLNPSIRFDAIFAGGYR